MARGDVIVFRRFWVDLGEEVHKFSVDTLKAGIVDDTITPAVDDTTPTWGDYSANEVSGTNYPTGGVTLTSVTWSETGGVVTLDSDGFTISYSASGFNDGYWLILYNDSAGSDEAICAVDLGGPIGNDSEDLEITVPTTGWVFTQKAA